MAVESLTCPKCGAPLTIEDNATTTVCAYCSSALRVTKDVTQRSVELLENAPGHAQVDVAEIRRLLREGHKIEAIKLYREQTGAGLKEAKDTVEALERGLPLSIAVKAHPTTAVSGSWLSGCLPVLGVIGLCIVSISLLSQIMFRVFGPLDVVLDVASRNPQVIEVFGAPLRPGLFIFGEISGGGSSTHAGFEVPLFGSKTSGYLNASGTWSRGRWDVSIWITYDEAGEEVEIFMTNE